MTLVLIFVFLDASFGEACFREPGFREPRSVNLGQKTPVWLIPRLQFGFGSTFLHHCFENCSLNCR
jgi:hypothetical protein